jgi:hypothetical protein
LQRVRAGGNDIAHFETLLLRGGKRLMMNGFTDRFNPG